MKWFRHRRLQQAAALILAVPLLIWGFGSTNPAGMRGGQKTVIAIDGVKVSAQQALHAVQRFMQYAPQLPANVVREQAWSALLVNAARLAYAQNIGVWVSDQKTAQAVRQIGALQDAVTGQFSDAALAAYAQQQGLSKRAFTEEVRADLQRQALEPLFSPQSLPTNVAQRVGQLYARAMREQRTIDYVVLRQKDATVPAPTDEQLQSFYSTQQAQFKAPERRTIAALVVSPQSMRDKMTITPAQIDADYKANIAQYTTPVQRDVYQLLFPTMDAANAAVAQLQGGDKLNDTLKATKQTAAAHLGLMGADGLPAKISDVVFALPEKTFSAPQQTPFGVAIYYVARQNAAQAQPLSAVKTQIEQRLRQSAASTAAIHLAETLQEDAAGGLSVQELAQRHQLQPIVLQNIDNQGRDDSNKNIVPDALRAPQFLERCFLTAAQNEVLTLDLPDGRSILYTVQNVVAPHTPPLDKVRAQVLAAYNTQHAAQLVQTQAATLAARVANPAQWQSVTQPLGVKSTQRQRGQGDPVLADDVLQKLFASKGFAPVIGSTTAGDAVVAVVQKTSPAAPNATAEEALGKEILALWHADLERSILLQRHKKVILNREAFDQMLEQQQ